LGVNAKSGGGGGARSAPPDRLSSVKRRCMHRPLRFPASSLTVFYRVFSGDTTRKRVNNSSRLTIGRLRNDQITLSAAPAFFTAALQCPTYKIKTRDDVTRPNVGSPVPVPLAPPGKYD